MIEMSSTSASRPRGFEVGRYGRGSRRGAVFFRHMWRSLPWEFRERRKCGRIRTSFVDDNLSICREICTGSVVAAADRRAGQWMTGGNTIPNARARPRVGGPMNGIQAWVAVPEETRSGPASIIRRRSRPSAPRVCAAGVGGKPQRQVHRQNTLRFLCLRNRLARSEIAGELRLSGCRRGGHAVGQSSKRSHVVCRETPVV